MTDLVVMPENAKTEHPGTLTLIAGYDLGNSGVKFVSSDRKIKFPSYLENCYYRPTEPPSEGYVEYLDGEAITKLDYKQWLSGFAAYDANPKNHLRVTDDATAKVTQSLKHLLATLSYYPYQSVIDLIICVSLHERGDLEEQLIDAIAGRHIVKFGGKPRPTMVNINVLKVYDEGHAAIAANAHTLDTSKQNVIVDIGNRTVIATLIGQKGHLANRKTFDNGVEELIRMISGNPTFKNRLLGEIAIPHLIRQGLESTEKSFWYGKQFSFEDVYRTELMPWVQKSLAPVFKFIHPWKINADTCLIIGGGSQLIGVDEALKTKGFVIAENPVWANAQGLYQLATLMYSRGINE